MYIIECKIDRTAKEAMTQIDEKGYVQQYLDKIQNGYSVIKVGMNFSSRDNDRNINEFVTEMV